VSVRMKLYRNGDGNPCVELGASGEVVGRFLTEDIQDSLSSCHEIEKVIERIFRGEIASWRRVGNGHILSLSRDEAIIESLFEPGGKPSHLSLGDFRDIVRKWLQFLDNPK
jgi:uncharacterized protein YacL (UPF0231 family)